MQVNFSTSEASASSLLNFYRVISISKATIALAWTEHHPDAVPAFCFTCSLYKAKVV